MPGLDRRPADEARLAWAYVAREHVPPSVESSRLPFAGSSARFLGREDILLLDTSEADSAGAPYDLIPISAYTHLPPRRRPPAFCPVCLGRVWLKLGRRVRHHYQHAAHSHCLAARAEGALHLAAKLHLASQLATVDAVRIERRCHGATTAPSERCAHSETGDWVSGWDEVRVEQVLPALRADLLLLCRSQPVAAIEIYATHAVDDLRADRYRDIGIPWLEVPADAIVAPHGRGWTPDRPLPAIGDSRLHPELWRCPRHRFMQDAHLELQRTGTHRLATRVVHLYRLDGGLTAGERRVDVIQLSMIERREEGEIVEAWLEREDRDGRIGSPVRTRDRDHARRELHRHFLDWIRWNRTHRGAIADSPMPWIPPDQLPTRGRDTLFPQRLRWDSHAARFRPAPNLPALAWPALRHPAADSLRPDPVLGLRPCLWTALATADKPPALHAIAGDRWVTVRLHRWTEDGVAMTRATVETHRHTGTRWVSEETEFLTVRDGAVRWEELALEVAEGGGAPSA